MDSEEVAVGWWPGDQRYPRPAFYAYAHPAPEAFSRADLAPARWDGAQGLYVLDWNDLRSSDDPHATAVAFAPVSANPGLTACARRTNRSTAGLAARA